VRRIIYLVSLIITAVSCNNIKEVSGLRQENFPNLLNIQCSPESFNDDSKFFFADKGAWFGFSLSDTSKSMSAGSFSGPFIVEQRKWYGKDISFFITDNKGNKLKIGNEKITYLPGRLNQKFIADSVLVESDLFFISDKSAMLKISLLNLRNKVRKICPVWKQEFFTKKFKVNSSPNKILIEFPGQDLNLSVRFNGNYLTKTESSEYTAKTENLILLPKGEKYNLAMVITLTDTTIKREEQNLIKNALRDPVKYLKINKKTWNRFINNTLISDKWGKDKKYTNIAVKSLMTLMVNFRTARKDLLHGGFFPSVMINYFDGFWAWDSWKHSAAVARIDGNMAKEQIRAMFDYQTKEGMVPDAIYTDKRLNNNRDTKPPLAGWAVWRVYEETGDQKFLRDMYEKLTLYHNWWYKFRDHDHDGLCEYGSTDGTLTAAKWESGMDDAVRFDKTKILRNGPSSWSMDQESVCLNSFLYAEKKYLSKIAGVLNMIKDQRKWEKEADELKRKIQKLMFDPVSGYFYDTSVDNTSLVKVMGSEGWSPLWAWAADEVQAKAVKKVMENKTKFLTFVPLPTVASDENEFMTGYWRGPVWLDQVYFGVSGLRKYGYNRLADSIFNAVINNCRGLAQNGTIRENYDPRNGAGLKVHYFSWSAASILLMYWGL